MLLEALTPTSLVLGPPLEGLPVLQEVPTCPELLRREPLLCEHSVGAQCTVAMASGFGEGD